MRVKRSESRRVQQLTCPSQLPSAMDMETTNGDEEEEGEVTATDIARNKVHVRGTDVLTTKDLENFAHDHYPSDRLTKVEWIDDNSANIIYETSDAAVEALNAFSTEYSDDPLELRLAKELATHPQVHLSVRQATASDVKQPGAAKRSRFYLMNPDYDPESQPRRGRFNDERWRRPRGRARHENDSAGRRRGSGDDVPFDVNLYDEDTGTTSEAKGYQSDKESAAHGKRAGGDLFAGKQQARLRNRSASPIREGDGRYGFEDNHPYRRTARRRSPSPGLQRRANRGARDDLRVELFPRKKSTSALTNGHDDASAPRVGKELFPDKVNHKRHDAKDLHPDEVAVAIGQYNFDGQNERGTWNRSSRGRENIRQAAEPRDLFSRIDGGPGMKVDRSQGRLTDEPASDGFSIKGAGERGFSILGASKDKPENPLVKELFQRKTNTSDMDRNRGKDLFDGRIKGRGSQRKMAEDLF